MKNKLVEGIRRFLQKTVLPFRKKRQEIAGGVRLSITHRIAMNYLKLLILNGVLFFLIFPFLYINAQKGHYEEMADKIIVSLINGDGTLGKEVNPYSEHGVHLILFEVENDREIYNDLNYKMKTAGGIFKRFHFNLDTKDNSLIINKDLALDNEIVVIRRGKKKYYLCSL